MSPRIEVKERKFLKPISRLICVLGIGHLYLKGSKTSHFIMKSYFYNSLMKSRGRKSIREKSTYYCKFGFKMKILIKKI